MKNKSLKFLTATTPWLNSEELASTETFHFETSDGLRLEAYFTRPRGAEGPYPTIALVHGGPWVRDYHDYDDETQLFASRGYAVLRVNYRGSSGFGKAISDDGAYAFRKMQDDITEAVKHMVARGEADASRLAIMGASFGGYAALCGAAFEPDLYRCAITNMGVFDWEAMIKSRKWQGSRSSFHELKEAFGNPKENEERFLEISPIYHIDKIEVPIFVIHGKLDRNVSIKQSKKLRAELKRHKVENEVYFVPGEGHNLFDVGKRVKTYERILSFLERHMRT